MKICIDSIVKCVFLCLGSLIVLYSFSMLVIMNYNIGISAFFILGFVYCACYTTCCSVNLQAIKIKRHMMKIKGLSRTEAARIQVYFGVGAFSALVAVLFTVLLNPCSNMLFGIL